MKTLKCPAVGSDVTALVKMRNINLFDEAEFEVKEFSGRVVANKPWNSAWTFSILTGNPSFPVSVIDLRSCIDIKSSTKLNAVVRHFNIKGSKGDRYVVTKSGSNYSCTCPGFKFHGGKCKHIEQVKSR